MGEDAALQQLQDILARPEFQWETSRPFWEQLLAPIGELLVKALAQFVQLTSDTLSGREGWFGLSALALALVVLLAGGAYLVRSVRLAVTRESRVQQQSAALRRQRSDELWHEAQQLASQGRLADATRLAYLSALYVLDERALLHVENSLTNREHAHRVGADHPRVGATFVRLVDAYDRLRFGRSTVTAENFAELVSLATAAREAATGA